MTVEQALQTITELRAAYTQLGALTETDQKILSEDTIDTLQDALSQYIALLKRAPIKL